MRDDKFQRLQSFLLVNALLLSTAKYLGVCTDKVNDFDHVKTSF